MYNVPFSTETSPLLLSGTSFVSNSGISYARKTIGYGVWLVCGTCTYSSVTATTNFYAQIAFGGNTHIQRLPHPSYSNTWYQSITGVLVLTAATTTVDITLTCSFGGTAPKVESSGFEFTLTRIA